MLKKWLELTIELPTQIPMVSSILFFIAIHIEVTCSAALACISFFSTRLFRRGID